MNSARYDDDLPCPGSKAEQGRAGLSRATESNGVRVFRAYREVQGSRPGQTQSAMTVGPTITVHLQLVADPGPVDLNSAYEGRWQVQKNAECSTRSRTLVAV